MTMARRDLRLVGAADTASMRQGVFNGAPHLIVPVVALIGDSIIWASGAEGPEFVPLDVIAQAPLGWNGRPTIGDHPRDGDGVNISANVPLVLEREQVGWVFNAELRDGRLCVEAWVDTTKAASADLVRRLRAGEMVEVSIGAFVTLDEVAGTHDGVRYVARWKNLVPDHLALLPSGATGACSVEMGCGAPRAATAREMAALASTTAGSPFVAQARLYGLRHVLTASGVAAEVRGAGLVPRNVSTALAPDGAPWRAPGLADFSDGSWDGLTDERRRAIAGHFAWVDEDAPSAFGACRLPHHRASDGKVVPRGVAAALAQLDGMELPEADRARVREHLLAHQADIDAARERQRAEDVTAAGAAQEGNMTRQERIAALGRDGRIGPDLRDLLVGRHGSALPDATVAEIEQAAATVRTGQAVEVRDGAAVVVDAPVQRRTLRERLVGMLATVFTSAADDMSDVDLRAVIDAALRASEPGYVGVEAIFPSESRVVYSVAPTDTYQWIERTYALADDGTVALNDDRREVRPVTRFEPVTAAEADHPAGAAPCGCGNSRAAAAATEGANMTSEQAKARAQALVDHAGTPWTAEDLPFLSALSEDRLAAFEAQAPKAAPVTEPVAQPAAASAAGQMTEEQWLAQAPADVRGEILASRAATAARKGALVARMAAAQTVYTQADLQAMPMADLEKVARLADVAAPADYTGRGLAAGDTSQDWITKPPDPWSKGRQASQ